MTLQLSLTLPLMEDEPTTYFVSRLAARNFLAASAFANDQQIKLLNLDRSVEWTISRLSEISGVSHESLTANACRHEDSFIYMRGQKIERNTRRNSSFVICPACLEEDIKRNDLPASSAIHSRIQWTLESIRTCTKHGLALQAIPEEPGLARRYDWSDMVAPIIPHLQSMAEQAILRPPSKLEIYLSGRLNGKAQSCWLDNLDYHVVDKIAQLFGRATLFGKNFTDELSDDQKYAAGDIGFDIVKDGPGSIPDFLLELQKETVQARRLAGGAGSAYGLIYRRLSLLCDNSAYARVVDTVRDHILSSMPLGPGNRVLGKEVTERRFHTVHTLSRQYKAAPVRIVKVMRSEGLLPDDKDGIGNVMIDASRAEFLVERELNSVNLKDAERYLSASEQTMKCLLEGGILQRSRFTAGTHGLRFVKAELDGLLERVLEGAEVIEDVPDGATSLGHATNIARTTIGTIVQLMLDRKLRWVGRRVGLDGFSSILIDPKDVVALLDRPVKDGLSTDDAAAALQVSRAVMRRLGTRKFVESFNVRDRSSSRKKWRYVESSVVRFDSEFISLAGLSRQLCKPRNELRREFEARGAQPVEGTLGIGAVIYRRAEVALP